MHKLSDYEKEEIELRKTLEQPNVDTETDLQASNIVKWRKALFGGQSNPQFDFNGDLERFISVRYVHFYVLYKSWKAVKCKVFILLKKKKKSFWKNKNLCLINKVVCF